MRISKSQFLLILIGIAILMLFDAMVSRAQINPIGFSLTIDGKIEIKTEEKTNYAYLIKDTVIISCQGKTSILDLEDFEDETLTLVSCPDPNWTNYSQIPDQCVIEESEKSWFLDIPNWDVQFLDTNFIDSSQNKGPSKFEDVVLFHGEMNDSIKNHLKSRLIDYIHNFNGQALDNENFKKIADEFSSVDSVVDKKEYYDFLIDKLVFYEYTDDKLTGIIGYFYHNAGIEVDSLRYDDKGRLIYWHRASLGLAGDRLHLCYDDNDRVIETKMDYYYYHSSQYEHCASCKVVTPFEHFKYSYSKEGIIQSKENQDEEMPIKCLISIPCKS